MVESHRFGVILFIIFFLLLAPDTSPVNQREEIEATIDKEKRELGELQNSTYGVPGNITGLADIGKRVGDEPVRMLPPQKVRDTVKDMIRSIIPTGDDARFIHGATSNIQPKKEMDKESEKANESPQEILVEANDPARVEARDGNSEQTSGDSRLENGKPLEMGELPLYHNASGTIRGDWKRIYDLPPYIPIDHSRHFDKNITSDRGSLFLRLEEAKPGATQEVEAGLSIKNEAGWDSQDIHLNGVHFVKSGDMVLTTTSGNFSGIFALPHFTLDEAAYASSKEFVIEGISEAIAKQEESMELNLPLPFSSDQGSNSWNPRCEYIVYFQLHPVKSPQKAPDYPFYDPRWLLKFLWADYTPITPDILREIEQELRYHEGAPLPPAPPIILSGVIYSPTCGFVLELNEAKGLKSEKSYDRASNFALSASMIIGMQTWLLIRQMNESNTPSTLSRVSFWSIAMMAIVDGYMAAAFILVSIIVQSSYLPLVTAAFLSFVLVVVFGMRFLLTLWGVQRPERRAQAATTNPNPTPPPGELPAPVTATPNTPLIIPANQDPTTTNNTIADANNDDGRQDMSILYSRFYFILVGGAFLFLHVASWPPFYRHIFIDAIIFLASSFWVPQIYRNVLRGCRKALTWEFVLGTSLCRIAPIFYLFFVDENVFYFRGDWRVGALLVGWVWGQVVALMVQEMLGARFFVPENLLPPAYDYHPILPIDDLEAAQPFAAMSSPTSTTTPNTNPPHQSQPHTHGPRTFDCAICMHPVEVPTIASTTSSSTAHDTRRNGGTGEGGGGGGAGLGLLSRRNYMVTPCRHVFHSVCLEGWMRFRLQCPICRNQLPPL